MKKSDKRCFIKIAKELCYSNDVIKKLEEANSENECVCILNSARKNRR